MKPFAVYLLRCVDGSYYVGHTDDLAHRVAEHTSGHIPGYTHDRRPVELVWSQETAGRDEALAAERQIKGWTRAKKEALIAGNWAQVAHLARSKNGLRQAQPERDGSTATTVRPEPVEGLVPERAGLRQAQPERGEAHPNPATVRPELVEGLVPERAGLRQAQPERGEAHPNPATVHPELVEGLAPERAGLRQAQPERGEAHPNPATVRPQLVEGLAPERAGLRQAQPERGEAHPNPATVHPELVEGLVQERAGLRQAQPERGEAHPNPATVHPELVEGLAPERAGLRQAQPERDGSADTVRPELVEGPLESRSISPDPLLAGICHGERRALAKAITLLESTRRDHRRRADALLNALLPATGQALRVGISGVPGVGKSTFVEVLGLFLIARGHRVAVLAIDPSSSVSGGSILGDKTRMERLSVDPKAYIRPSPASGTLGGVAEKTREAMLVCEAAGHDIVIVETVGVGQSETAVARMTDLFVLLQLPNAGDDLQAIKKGVMEIADLVVVNKADLDPAAALRAQAQIASALRVFGFHGRATPSTQPQVLLLSALKNDGVTAFWERVEALSAERRASGEFDKRRRAQALDWMWDIVEARLRTRFDNHPQVREALPGMLAAVAEARITPSSAARVLLDLLDP